MCVQHISHLDIYFWSYNIRQICSLIAKGPRLDGYVVRGKSKRGLEFNTATYISRENLCFSMHLHLIKSGQNSSASTFHLMIQIARKRRLASINKAIMVLRIICNPIIYHFYFLLETSFSKYNSCDLWRPLSQVIRLFVASKFLDIEHGFFLLIVLCPADLVRNLYW